MREGASSRFATAERTMISGIGSPSDITSYIERSSDRTSMNDIEELAWGSRSISSVRWPRNARAAARLIAVVVFPTPPFWLAIAMTITARGSYYLHLVLAQLFVGEVLEPFLEPAGVDRILRLLEALGVMYDGLPHVDGRLRPQRQRDRVGGPRVDRPRHRSGAQVDHRVERVV